ncbi:MAG: GAF domain-containing protein [Gammaproteobacteria bacterium]|nr:MAG: GAF domain-containing protein [Gammaproteobacteria bacterium]
MLEFLKIFLRYAKETSTLKLVFHILVLLLVIAWAAVFTTIALNFPTVSRLYTAWQNDRALIETSQIKQHMLLNMLASQILSFTGADRVTIFKFTTAVRDANRLSPDEVIVPLVSASSPGITSEIDSRKQIPIIGLSSIIKELHQNRCLIVNDVTLMTDEAARDVFTNAGSISIMVCPIKDQINTYGMVLIENVKAPANLTPEQITDIKQKLQLLHEFLIFGLSLQ